MSNLLTSIWVKIASLAGDPGRLLEAEEEGGQEGRKPAGREHLACVALSAWLWASRKPPGPSMSRLCLVWVNPAITWRGRPPCSATVTEKRLERLPECAGPWVPRPESRASKSAVQAPPLRLRAAPGLLRGDEIGDPGALPQSPTAQKMLHPEPGAEGVRCSIVPSSDAVFLVSY